MASRVTKTRDVARGLSLLLVGAGAVAGGVAAAFGGPMPVTNGHPLARPHAAKNVACATCHHEDDAKFASAAACKTCHAGHASERAGHRALAVRGDLTCATCHPAHTNAVQGVTFAANGDVVRWGAGAEAEVASSSGPRAVTVPLVPLSVCTKCHDPARASDPIAACVPAKVRAAGAASTVGAAGATDAGAPLPTALSATLATTPSGCFDEHKTAAARFVAWEAARDVAHTTPWVTRSEPSSSPPWTPLGGALAGGLVLAGAAKLVERRRAKPAAPPVAKPTPPERKLLPTINTSTCLGCYACVDACPFDVLAIEKYVAVVARPEECCGVVTCAQVCPNGSLTIATGEPHLDRPAVDEHLESRDVPGIFVAGDLTGLPLIKNAINQGVRAVDRIAATLAKAKKDATAFDVVVVGAGPAGLSAALRAKEKGLRCVVLEQATVAASVKSFPRDKIVYDPPLDLPVEGELPLREATKDELVAQWTRIVRVRALDVREGRRVTAVTRDGDLFTLEAGGEAFRARRVVLAIGRRGTPRALDLDVEPGAEGRIAYALADARSFEGKRVVVVGLGDSAMEAAVAIARQPGTTVTISYRGKTFQRGKARNIGEVENLVAKGRIKLLFDTTPVAVTAAHVTLAAGDGRRRNIQADHLLVLIGGVPSWDLLEGVGLRRPSS